LRIIATINRLIAIMQHTQAERRDEKTRHYDENKAIKTASDFVPMAEAFSHRLREAKEAAPTP
jgi:hypothetical protein